VNFFEVSTKFKISVSGGIDCLSSDFLVEIFKGCSSNDGLGRSILDGLMVSVLFLLEGLLGGIETFFFGGHNADGDEEAEESNEGVNESHNLPENVVSTVR